MKISQLADEAGVTTSSIRYYEPRGRRRSGAGHVRRDRRLGGHSPLPRLRFINSLAETSQMNNTHRTIIAAHKRDLVEHLARLAARDHPNASSWLAAALAVIVDGAIVQCTVFAATDPLDAARSAVHHLLETIPA